MGYTAPEPDQKMTALSPREATERFKISRATLMKAIKVGTISAKQDGGGGWRIEAAELSRVYKPRPSGSVVKPGVVQRSKPSQTADAVRVEMLEVQVARERELVDELRATVDDLRRRLDRASEVTLMLARSSEPRGFARWLGEKFNKRE